MCDIFASGNLSVMTAGAGLRDVVVFEHGISPAGCAVTIAACLTTCHMVGWLADGCMPIVAAAAGTNDRHMIDFSHLAPGGSGMTVFAGSGRVYVVQVLDLGS